jgi:hypothetical protein
MKKKVSKMHTAAQTAVARMANLSSMSQAEFNGAPEDALNRAQLQPVVIQHSDGRHKPAGVIVSFDLFKAIQNIFDNSCKALPTSAMSQSELTELERLIAKHSALPQK